MDETKKLLVMRGQKNKVVAIYYEDGEEISRAELPHKEWQGLTEDEVAQAMFRADAIVTGPMQFKFAKEIEAKLKEKNG
jgi:ribosomal protein L25 (general stress protein Ctc)